MTTTRTADTAPLDPSLDASIEHACARIAPTWPLDRMIAVNPLWSWVDQPMPQVASRLAALCGARLHMPRSWALAQWQAGRLTLGHLRQAIERAHAPCTPQQLIDWMTSPQPTVARRERITDVADAARDTAHQPRWADFVTHHLSQTCAAYFDDGQAQLRPDPSVGL
ncbi:MAG: DUF2309 family protein, partial [Betaproteobacteria bacterium]|nr:DUF2309 family protein [Betaproteobacteria bacterium]